MLTPFVTFMTKAGYEVHGPTMEEIAEWCRYFTTKGIKQEKLGRKAISLSDHIIGFMDEFGSWTVPTQWPWEFDREYNRPFEPRWRGEPPIGTPEYLAWQEIVAEYHGLIWDDHYPQRFD